MSEADNFDTLSNKEIHAKCMEVGLPNVPVTDSSRKVLIKKLRLSIGSSPQKKTNRRETIAAPKLYPNIKELPKPAATKRAGSEANSRRTIAAPVSNANEKVAAAAAPVSTRRRSMLTEQVKPKTIDKDFVIIESDDEDDDLMIEAVKRIEHNNVVTSNRSSNLPVHSVRGASLTKTAVISSSYNQAVPPPLQEEITIRKPSNDSGLHKFTTTEPLRGTTVTHTPYAYEAHPYQTQSKPLQKPYQYQQEQPVAPVRNTVYDATRYSALDAGASQYYSPPLRRTTAGVAASSLRATTAAYNEYSDDTDGAYDEVNPKSPFLSSFARNLERNKTDPIKRNSGRRAVDDIAERRHRRTQVYENVDYNPEPESLIASLLELFEILEQRFHLKRTFAFLLALVLIVLICFWFWQ